MYEMMCLCTPRVSKTARRRRLGPLQPFITDFIIVEA